MNKKGLYLQSADLKGDDLDITISNSTYRSHIRSSSYAADTALSVAEEFNIDIDNIKITHLNSDMELNKIDYISSSFERPNYKELVKKDTLIKNNGVNTYKSHEFVPNLNFPAFFYGWTPALVNHIGSPEKFLFAGVVIRVDTELQFSRRLMLSTNINFEIANNFDEKVSDPGSPVCKCSNGVVRYFQEGTNISHLCN